MLPLLRYSHATKGGRMTQRCAIVVLAFYTVLVGCGCGSSEPEPTPAYSARPVSPVPSEPTLSTPTPTPRASPSPTLEPTPPSEPTLSFAERVERNVSVVMREGLDVQYRPDGPLTRYPGIMGTILVGLGDDIIFNQSNGMADVEDKVPHTPGTRFPLGRIADLFAATAILQLHERGELDIDEPIGVYVPDFPNGNSITLHHLLTHTSGIPHIWDWEVADSSLKRDVLEEAVDVLKTKKNLKYQPGEKFNWASGDVPTDSDYIMVKYLIERVSGLTFGDYLKDYIFNPAGMSDTVYAAVDANVENRALGYNLVNMQRLERTDASEIPTLIDGDHVIWSTSEDLFRWYRALVTGDLVGQDLVDRMFTPAMDLIDRGGSAGYGWTINHTSFRQSTWHSVRLAGYNVEIRGFPNADAFIVLLTNLEDYFPPLGQITWAIMSIVAREMPSNSPG